MTEVEDRQSLLDVSVVDGGSVETLWGVCARGDLSPTTELSVGAQVVTPDVSDLSVVARYAALGIRPATELTAAENESVTSGGIGFMAVGTTFIIG